MKFKLNRKTRMLKRRAAMMLIALWIIGAVFAMTMLFRA